MRGLSTSFVRRGFEALTGAFMPFSAVMRAGECTDEMGPLASVSEGHSHQVRSHGHEPGLPDP